MRQWSGRTEEKLTLSPTLRAALAGEASCTVTAVAVNIVNTHAAILTRIRLTLVDIFLVYEKRTYEKVRDTV